VGLPGVGLPFGGREHLFPAGSRIRSVKGIPRPFELASRERAPSSRIRARTTDPSGTNGDVFIAHGRDWKVVFQGREILAPDAIGVRQLRHLLSRPWTRIPALELVSLSAARFVDRCVADPDRGTGRAGDDVALRGPCPDAERARVNVTRTIRRAIAALSERHPSLGEHLRHTIRTGAACSYLPDPAYPRAWRTEPSLPRPSTQEKRERSPKGH
jgi:hypothetical protein